MLSLQRNISTASQTLFIKQIIAKTFVFFFSNFGAVSFSHLHASVAFTYKITVVSNTNRCMQSF